MSAASHLVEQIAGALASYVTHDQMPSIAGEAGLVISAAQDGVSKRDRARQAMAGKSAGELGEIARRLGQQRGDFELEEAGLSVLEGDSPPITEITRRDVAKCFGDELSGELNLVALLRRFFTLNSVGGGFLRHGLADEIDST
jgi:hypothetical protein